MAKVFSYLWESSVLSSALYHQASPTQNATVFQPSDELSSGDCIHSLIGTRSNRAPWKTGQAFHKNICDIDHTLIQK